MKKKKTLAKLKQDFQKVFNKYIRERDSEDGYFICISCGENKPIEVMNAGHFFAVKGYDALRFNELNNNGECAGCNCFNESHLIGYHDNLLDKIGSGGLSYLKVLAEQYKRGVMDNRYYFNGKWDRLALEEGIEEYKLKLKEL